MMDIKTRSSIARAAEARFAEIVVGFERETGLDLPHLKSVQYTIDRARTSDTGQEPYHRQFPALRSSPYWNLEEIPNPIRNLLGRFETEFSKIRREFDRSRDPKLFVDGRTGYFGVSEDWRHLIIMRQDVTLTDVAREQHPHLCSILDDLTALHVARKCYFALLRPGAHLANHCGGTNLFLRLHLGIQIPSGDTGLRVGGEARRWREGEILLFDDSFAHEAWNYTSADRYILLLRVVHPDLSRNERALLPAINRAFAASSEAKAVNEVLRSESRNQD